MRFINCKLLLSAMACLLGLLLMPGKASAQLVVSGAMTPTQLVQNVLLGPGVFAWNFSYTGSPSAIGSFSNGANTNLGLNSGIILASGNITNAVGPNLSSGITTAFNLPGDPDLNTIIAPTPTWDASVLEFDFIPTGDSIKFRFIFASDEYPEFANSSIMDCFGFFLSGVTVPTAAMNLAVVPNTATPITINTINCQNNSPYYVCNDPNNSTAFQCPASYVCPTSTASTTIEYDGFTTVLTAKAAVVCGNTYHIKIAIADGADQILDSGVFLEGGSFSSSSNVQMSSTIDFGGNDTTMYEGCSSATVVFDRGSTNLANADTINYTITGTATNGTDYSFIPSFAIFPAGVDTAFVTLNALTDALNAEGIESITFVASYTNPCTGQTTYDSLTLYITDVQPVTVTASADTFITCPGEVIPLSAQAAGGVGIGGYTYSWAPAGGPNQNINVTPGSTTTYTVTATDSCGVITATDQVTVTVLPYTYPQMTMLDRNICLGDSIDLIAATTGGLPQYTFQWSDNTLPADSIVTVAPAVTTQYTVAVSDYCNNTDTVSATVYITTVTAAFTFSNETNSIVNFFDQSSPLPVTWEWSFDEITGGDPAGSFEQNPVHTYSDTGRYVVQLIVTNAAGCSDTVIEYITVLPDMYFYFPSAFTPNGDGNNDHFTGYGLGIEKYKMMIFNRWGEMLYETDNMNNGWDGRTRSGPAEQEVYVAVFHLEGDVDGVKKKVKYIGRVTLLR